MWWWLPLMALAALLIMSAWLGAWLSDIARTEAMEAARLPAEQVDAHGLDITLTGLRSVEAADKAVQAVEALASSRTVTAELAFDTGTGGAGTGIETDTNEPAGDPAADERDDESVGAEAIDELEDNEAAERTQADKRRSRRIEWEPLS